MATQSEVPGPFHEEPSADDHLDLLSMGHGILDQAHNKALQDGKTDEEAGEIAFQAWVTKFAYGEFNMPPLPGSPKDPPSNP